MPPQSPQAGAPYTKSSLSAGTTWPVISRLSFRKPSGTDSAISATSCGTLRRGNLPRGENRSAQNFCAGTHLSLFQAKTYSCAQPSRRRFSRKSSGKIKRILFKLQDSFSKTNFYLISLQILSRPAPCPLTAVFLESPIQSFQ